MNKQNNIEDDFKNAFNSFESNLPDSVWSNVEKNISKKKRRFFIWWITLGTAFCVLGIGILIDNFITSPSKRYTSINTVNTIEGNNLFEQNLPEEMETKIDYNSEKNQKIIEITENESTSASQLLPEKKSRKTSLKINYDQETLIPANGESRSKQKSAINKSINTYAVSIETVPRIEPVATEQPLTQKTYNSLLFLDSKSIALIPVNVVIENPTSAALLNSHKEEEKESNSDKQKLYAAIHVSPILNLSSYENSRKENQSNQFSYLVNGLIGYNLNKKSSVSLGVEYTSLSGNYSGIFLDTIVNEEINTTTAINYTALNSTLLDSTWTGSSWFYFKDTTWIYSYDTIKHSLIDRIKVNTSNYINILSIPFSFDYTIFNSEKWNVSPSGSFIYNLVLKAKDSWFDPRLNELVTINKASFKSSLSYRISLGILYRLKPKISLSFVPSYTSNLNSIYKEETSIKMKPKYLDFRLGLRYTF